MLLSPPPKMQFFGDDGLPLSGGLVYTYEKDTTTPLATYTDSTGSVANANPIVLDPYGYASVWFQILPYSLVIYNSLGVLQNSSGPIEFSQSATSGSDIAAWSDIVVYDYPDQVAGSDGYTYRCVGTNILDDDPVGSVTGAWVNLSSLASAALTGTPTAPTAAPGTNTTQIATCAFVQAAILLTGPKAIKVFTSSGTYTPTAGANKAIIELVGGGGGGGGVAAGGSTSSGSAGGYSRKYISLSGVTTVAVTIGAAGAGGGGGANGGTGGTTSFGAYCSATGGGPGKYNDNAGTPGVGSGGNVNLYGGVGGGGNPNADTSGGNGGASFFGSGGAHGGPNGYDGSAGLAPGSGGGGARGYNSGSANGGAGAAGIVIVTEY